MRKIFFVAGILTFMLALNMETAYAQRAVRLDNAIRDAAADFARNIRNDASVAVLSIEATDMMAELLIEDIVSVLFNRHGFRNIVERHRIDAIFREQNLQRSREFDPNTAVRIGRLVGAQYVVTGSFTRHGDSYRLAVRMLDVETGIVTAAPTPAIVQRTRAIDDRMSAAASPMTGSRRTGGLPDGFGGTSPILPLHRIWIEYSPFYAWKTGEDSHRVLGYLSGGLYWAPVRFIAIGLEVRSGPFQLIDGEYDNPWYFSAAPALRLEVPLGNVVRVFSTGLLDLGTFGRWYGSITDWATPGFDVGLEIGPFIDFSRNLIFNARYRGHWFQDSYAHSVSVGIGWGFW